MDKETDKKPYDKPRLRIIELLAEEVLAIGCKTTPAQTVYVPLCGSPGCAQGQFGS